jgi:hypothetical protein
LGHSTLHCTFDASFIVRSYTNPQSDALIRNGCSGHSRFLASNQKQLPNKWKMKMHNGRLKIKRLQYTLVLPRYPVRFNSLFFQEQIYFCISFTKNQTFFNIASNCNKLDKFLHSLVFYLPYTYRYTMLSVSST